VTFGCEQSRLRRSKSKSPGLDNVVMGFGPVAKPTLTQPRSHPHERAGTTMRGTKKEEYTGIQLLSLLGNLCQNTVPEKTANHPIPLT